MMKSTVKAKKNNFAKAEDIDPETGKKLPMDLMSRLAGGCKIQEIDPKTMKKLTEKNYKNLPEVV